MVHILGAGIAGLMLAEVLEQRKISWHIYEKDANYGSEASGKNAGIIRTYEADPVMRHYAVLSLDYYRDKEPSFHACGLILRPWEVDYAATPLAERRFSHARSVGYFLQDNGTVEPMQVLTRLMAMPRYYGEVSFNKAVKLVADGGRVGGLDAGAFIPLAPNDSVVIACGEGSQAIAEYLQRPLGLVAHRRTLFEFRNTFAAAGPVEWDEECGVYFRHSGQGQTLTATAGEQVPTTSGATAAEESSRLLEILARQLPFLTAENLLSERTCKRLTSLDNRPYVGMDPLIPNLFWFTGLGGRGVSLAPALAAMLADSLTGAKEDGYTISLSPARVMA